MPFTRIFMQAGKSAQYKKAVMDGIYLAMRDAFDVPENDQFMIVHEHSKDNSAIGWNYLGIERSPDLLMIQITANNTRTIEKKKAFYKAVADRLAKEPGVRPQDVFINLVEVAKENWSFGLGEAQYA